MTERSDDEIEVRGVANRPGSIDMAAALRADTMADTETRPLLRSFEELGLNRSQAKVLLAVLRLGEGGAIQIAAQAGVPRTSVYPLLKELAASDLVIPLSGESKRWASPGRDEVISRLIAAHEGRLTALQENLRQEAERARETLLDLVPEGPSVALPYVRQIHGQRAVLAEYNRLFSSAEREVLVCNQGPYGGDIRENEAVMSALRRGVRSRALYEAGDLQGLGSESFRRTVAVYHSAGVEARVTDRLPLRMAAFDERTVLLAMLDPVNPQGAYPTHLLVDHPGFAQLALIAFDQLWAAARPYDEG